MLAQGLRLRVGEEAWYVARHCNRPAVLLEFLGGDKCFDRVRLSPSRLPKDERPMTEHLSQLSSSTEAQREQALERFSLIQPFLEDDIPLTRVAAMHRLPLRTLRQWVQQYRCQGLVGLMRKSRSDRGKRRGLPAELVSLVEELALQKPHCSIAAIHRQITNIAVEQRWPQPSYGCVREIIRSLKSGESSAHGGGSKSVSRNV